MSSSAEVLVNVYHGDEIVGQVTREQSREMKATGEYFFFHHGQDLKLVRNLFEKLQTKLEESVGWNMPFGRLRASAMNEGSASCTGKGRQSSVPSYPIRYAFEGHLKSPRVAVINAGDRLHA